MSGEHCENHFPLSGGKDRIASHPSPATLYRWALKGIRGVKLETVMMGGRRYTSDEAVDRFFARLSQPQAASTAAPSKLRAEQIARAGRRADATF
jgi:Protein of unknown function (DUF1580)